MAQVFGIDKRTLALFRVLLALVMLSDLWNRAGNILPFYSDQGLLPRAAHIEIYRDMPWLFSLHMMNGLVAVQGLLFAAAIISALALLVGYRTWWATFFSWLLLISLHNRNPMVIQGGDALLRMLLFWSLFLPLGALFSLDRIWGIEGKPLQETASGERGEEGGDHANTSTVLSVGTFGVLLQVCFVYWFTVALKNDASWRSEGTALYYALSIDQMVKPLGSVLLNFPSLLRALTMLSMGIEAFGPVLALLPFWRLRLAVVGVFVGFHLMMGLCLTLGIFPFVAVVAWVLFVPGQAWDALEKRLQGSPDRILTKLVRRGLHIVQKLPPLLISVGFGHHSTLTPGRSARRNWVGQGVAAFFLFYIFLWNLRGIDNTTYSRILPQGMNWVGELTRTDQFWGMFAPFPLKEDGWYVAAARLENGKQVDLLRGGSSINWKKPDHLYSTYRDASWQKYQMNLWAVSNAAHRGYYVAYLIRQWNAEHPDLRIKSMELVYILETTLPDYRVSQPKKVVLWQEAF